MRTPRPLNFPDALKPASLFAILGVFTLGMAGCDFGNGADGPAGEVVPIAPKPTFARAIAVIRPVEGAIAADVFEQVIHHDASIVGLITDVFKVPPVEMGPEIRTQIDRGVSAIIVITGSEQAEDLSKPLAEARSAGVPVLILGSLVPDLDVPTVTFDDPDPPARVLVEKTIAAADAAGLPDSGEVILLVNGPQDEAAQGRLDALHRALDEAGVENVHEVRFTGYRDEARDALAPDLEPDPETGDPAVIRAILSIEDQGIGYTSALRNQMEHDPPRFEVASFIEDKNSRRNNEMNIVAVLAERNIASLAHRAFLTIEAMIEDPSAPAPGKIVVETIFHEPTGEERPGYLQEPGSESMTLPATPTDDSKKTQEPEPAEAESRDREPLSR